MGYSTPKKPLDLNEFLSQKATKAQMRNKSRFRFASRATGSVESAEGAAPAEATDAVAEPPQS